MKAVATFVLTLTTMMLWPTALGADQASAPVSPKVAQAFEQYELIRASLSADSLKELAPRAAALAPLAREVAGSPAEAAVSKLAGAKTLKDAREEFGDVSEMLVPKFLAAHLPGVHGFSCPMVKKPWAQKGDQTQNPYFGKSMPTCGTAIAR